MDVLGLAGRFLDPASLAIVIGGTLIAAATRVTRDDIASAVRALRPLVRADPAADAHAARLAVNRIYKIAEVRSIACADRVRTAEPFLRRAAFKLSEVASAVEFRRWADDELAETARRHDRAAGVWRAVADAAPAMGMIGTVIGLIQMFAAMDDTNAIGPAMALAMLTPLYGLFFGNVVAAPIAGRLERLSAEEAAWRAWALARLELLAAAELDRGGLRAAA